MIEIKVLDAIFDQVVQAGTTLAFDRFVETEQGRRILSKFGVSRELAAHDFDAIYKRAVMEYAVNHYRDQQTKQIVQVFADQGLQKAFETSFRTQDTISVQTCISALYEASTETGELAGIAPSVFEAELQSLSGIFNGVVLGLRPLYFDPLEHKLDTHTQLLLAEVAKLQELITQKQDTSVSSMESIVENVHVSASPQVTYLRKLTEIEEEIATNPASAEAWLRKAALLYKAHDMNAALKAINRASELDSKSVDILHGRACILCDYAASQCNSPKSFFVEALEIFEKVRTDIGEAHVDYHIGNALSGLGREEEAIAKYQQAIDALDDDELKARAWTNMGNSYISLSQGEKAVGAFQRALVQLGRNE